jgi:RimJ/RimL family protein N-acetyltransferase
MMRPGGMQLTLPDRGLTDGVVTLRHVSPAHTEAVFRACQDPEIPRWTSVPAPYEHRHAVEFVHASVTSWREGTGAHFVIADSADDRLVGAIGLVGIDPERSAAEVGYWVAAEARGRGTATRAVELLAAWALDDLGLVRLSLRVYAGNLRSERVAQKAGFRREGAFRSYEERGGERVDLVLYSLLASDLEP